LLTVASTSPGPAYRPGADAGQRPALLDDLVAALPTLDVERERALLNELGLAPDPAELHDWYFSQPSPGCDQPPRHTWQQAAILAQVQLHARTGTKIELRELARLAGIPAKRPIGSRPAGAQRADRHGDYQHDPTTAFRVVHRLQALGALQVDGGQRRRDEHGQVRRTCQRYRLLHPAGMPVKPERSLIARLYAWAVGAGVGAMEARSCCRAGRAGMERLAFQVRSLELDRLRHERQAQEAEERAEAERAAAQPPVKTAPLAGAVARSAERRARRSGRRPVQHGDPNTNRPPQPASRNGSEVGISPTGELPTYHAHVANAIPETAEVRQIRIDVMAYAHRVGANSPRNSWAMVRNLAARLGVPVEHVGHRFVSWAGEARDRSRSGTVKSPAGWAATMLRLELEGGLR
jgi:hypothetical protein